MKSKMGWQIAVLAALIALAVAPLSRAQGTMQSPGAIELSQEQLARSERTGEIERGKAAFANEMLAKFADGAVAKGYDAYWQKGQRNLLTRSADELLALSERATDFETFDKLVFQGFTVNSLGDLTQDLVFFPVAPCRLLDTRIGTGLYAGPKAPSTGVAFSVNDALAVQGGLAAGCGIPVSDPPALSVVVTAVPTNTGQGNLRTYPTLGTIPTASVVNYQGGVVVASGTITQTCTACNDELTVRNQGAGTTHIVVDVTGYFAAPNATALDCVTTADTSVAVAPHGTQNVVAPACDAGYTSTAVYCRSNSWDMPFVYQSGSTCSAQNLGASAASLSASQRCCRVPGQ